MTAPVVAKVRCDCSGNDFRGCFTGCCSRRRPESLSDKQKFSDRVVFDPKKKEYVLGGKFSGEKKRSKEDNQTRDHFRDEITGFVDRYGLSQSVIPSAINLSDRTQVTAGLLRIRDTWFKGIEQGKQLSRESRPVVAPSFDSLNNRNRRRSSIDSIGLIFQQIRSKKGGKYYVVWDDKEDVLKSKKSSLLDVFNPYVRADQQKTREKVQKVVWDFFKEHQLDPQKFSKFLSLKTNGKPLKPKDLMLVFSFIQGLEAILAQQTEASTSTEGSSDDSVQREPIAQNTDSFESTERSPLQRGFSSLYGAPDKETSPKNTSDSTTSSESQ